ncbi:MAG: ankyrin repeat domain-containing protein [Brevinematales bacterium]|nr:ankyrin repeat domain-containing protein [Brevinematales bacterium]
MVSFLSFVLVVFLVSCAPTKSTMKTDKDTSTSKRQVKVVKYNKEDVDLGLSNQGDKVTSKKDIMDVNKGEKDKILYTSYLDRMLRIACVKGDVGMVIKLIQMGVDVNSVDIDGDTPLHLAVMSNNYEIVRILVANKAVVKKRNKKGYTPIDIARELGYSDIYRLLLSSK